MSGGFVDMYAAAIVYAVVMTLKDVIVWSQQPSLLGLLVVLSTGSPVLVDHVKYGPKSNLRTIVDRMFFNWCTNIVDIGYKYVLQLDDLNPPRLEGVKDSADNLRASWLAQWDGAKGQATPSQYLLIKAIFLCYWRDLIPVLVFLNLREVLGISAPFILGRFVKFADSYQLNDSITPGIFLLVLLCVESLVNSALSMHSMSRSFMLLEKLDIGLGGLIYWKSVNISPAERERFSSGELLNMWTADRKKIQYLFNVIQISTYAPISLFTSLLGLHKLLGKSMWAGFAMTLALMIVNSHLNALLHIRQQQQIKFKDDRVKVTNEILSNIETIRYNVWESCLLDRINLARKKELLGFQSQRFLETVISAFVQLGPYLVAFSTISCYTFLRGERLRPELFIPATLIFRELRSPLTNIARIYNEPRRVVTGLARIQNFLMTDDAENFLVDGKSPNAVELEAVSLSWRDRPVFENVTHTILMGSFTCIVGRVGSGKTSFLRALIGDMQKPRGVIRVYGSTSYAAQRAWIKNATVKDNILFGRPFDKEWYQKVVYACALDEDIGFFVNGDETLVGEKGIELSGGQRARIGLARAVYARTDIYLLDDPLSAVDERVNKHIVKHVLSRSGLLSDRTVVMTTHALSILNHCNHILVVKDMDIVPLDSYQELRDKFPNFHEFMPDVRPALKEDVSSDKSMKRLAPLNSHSVLQQDHRKPLRTTSINVDAYVNYFVRSGKLLLLCILSGSLLHGILQVWANLWIGSNVNSGVLDRLTPFHGQSTVYLFIGLLGFSGRLLQDYISFRFFHIPESFNTYRAMVEKVTRSTMSYLDSENKGSLVDRFTTDIQDLDEKIPDELRQYGNEVFDVIISLGLLFYSSAYTLLAVLPFILVYRSYGSKIVTISKNAQKLVPERNSKALSRFQESVDGSSHIRAFDQKSQFFQSHNAFAQRSDGATFTSLAVRMWYQIRLLPLNSLLVLAIGLVILRTLGQHGYVTIPIGLVIGSARDLHELLITFSNATAQLANASLSLERIEGLLELETEESIQMSHQTDFIEAPIDWPANGEIVFDHFSKVYPGNLVALKDIGLRIRPGEKIGIVGRTGSGKSSLVSSLFRIREGSAGRILIDGLDISKINVYDLRRRLSIILQEPKMLSGTIRQSVDPILKSSDEQIWKALESSHVADFIRQLGGLDATVAEDGTNFSVGQRQLLCLSRALLSNAKIIILDEATASVDLETSSLIQQAVETQFKDKTVLIIAHRLSTIMNSDRVVVLEAGIVIECDSPKRLLETEGSQFRQLWDKSHEI